MLKLLAKVKTNFLSYSTVIIHFLVLAYVLTVLAFFLSLIHGITLAILLPFYIIVPGYVVLGPTEKIGWFEKLAVAPLITLALFLGTEGILQRLHTSTAIESNLLVAILTTIFAAIKFFIELKSLWRARRYTRKEFYILRAR